MKNKIDFELALFIYFILFSPKIGMIDLKLIAYFIFFVVSFRRRKELVVSRKFQLLFIPIIVLIIIFIINFFLNENVSFFILFRYIRCLISMICIFIYFKLRNLETKIVIQTIIYIICLHAIIIILCMLFPQIRPLINLLSGYNKKNLPLRSSGLLSGYDFAGFVLNIGLIITVMYNIKYKNKVFNLALILIIIATFFTSRVSTVFLMIQIVLVFLYILRIRRIKSSIFILILIPIVFLGSIMTILTIETFEPIKNELIVRYEWINTLNKTINMTYSQSSIDEVVNLQYYIDKNVNSMIGNAIQAPVDPGYINSIYEAGYVGLFVKIFGYLSVGIWGFIQRRKNYLYLFITYLVIITSFFEMKLVFYFASTSFEILILFMSLAILEDNMVINDI